MAAAELLPLIPLPEALPEPPAEALPEVPPEPVVEPPLADPLPIEPLALPLEPLPIAELEPEPEAAVFSFG